MVRGKRRRSRTAARPRARGLERSTLGTGRSSRLGVANVGPQCRRRRRSWRDTLAPSGTPEYLVHPSQVHKERGFDSPTAHKLVREVVTGIACTHGSAQTRKAAITTDVLGALLGVLDRETLRGQRDRAILLLGFSGAFPVVEARSARPLGPRVRRDRGVVMVRYSKTDQEGVGREVAVPFVLSNAQRCPVTAVRERLGVSGIGEGLRSQGFWT
jgi:hypothetical protein